MLSLSCFLWLVKSCNYFPYIHFHGVTACGVRMHAYNISTVKVDDILTVVDSELGYATDAPARDKTSKVSILSKVSLNNDVSIFWGSFKRGTVPLYSKIHSFVCSTCTLHAILPTSMHHETP